MIICGFAGIGKSYLGKTYPRFMDLESTPFEKDFDRYAKCAIHYSNQGYCVLVSCHLELRKKLKELLGHNYCYNCITVFPNQEDKDYYIELYKKRGNTREFIKNLQDNWEMYHKSFLGENVAILDKEETLEHWILRIESRKDAACFFCNYDECPVSESDKPYCKNPLSNYANIIYENKSCVCL